MRMRVDDLRLAVAMVLAETPYRRLGVKDTRPAWEREPAAYDKPEAGKGSIAKGKEAMSSDVEDEIAEMQRSPEFSSVDAFMNMKLDDEQYVYNFMELQALARNLAAQRTGDRRVTAPSPADIAAVRKELEGGVGFKYVPREPARDVRGSSSNSHGTHPFAGAGGGGSGFSSDREGGGGFTAFGGGPGALGGGYTWDPNDKKNLPMGSRRR